jgi:acyl carrier protein
VIVAVSDVGGAVIEVLADVLEVPSANLNRDSELDSFDNWDSMAALEVLMQLESSLRLRLNLQNYNELRTVGELIDLAEAKQTR